MKATRTDARGTDDSGPCSPKPEGPVEDGGEGGGDAPSSHLRQVDDAQQLPHVLGGEQPVAQTHANRCTEIPIVISLQDLNS